MADGFLARWSHRKQEVRASLPPQEPPPAPRPDAAPAPAQAGSTSAPLPAGQQNTASEPATPPPSLADAGLLTPQSDFKPFVAQGVTPEVKNAAMKKLFADPHYNVMDGLDIYIDDYSKPDPLPASMLRNMVSAQFLNLFDEEKIDPSAAPRQGTPPVDAQPAIPDAPIASATPASPELTTEDHAHTDLRLQPNHAAGAPSPGRGAQ